MRRPYREELIDVMDDNIYALQQKQMWYIVTWSLVFKVSRGVQSTCSFNINRFTYGNMIKIKAIFLRGNTKIYMVDYFDSYVPVDQGLTVWMMLAKLQVLGLKKKQADYTKHFLKLR